MKISLFDKPLKNLKAAGFKDENHFSDVLKTDILSGIEEIVGVDFDPNPEREGDGGGGFRADLVCTVTESVENEDKKSIVIIENQLGTSDHGHLGQCILYGSHRDAKTVVWICETFDDRYIKALQWLNDHFKDKVGFYGIEVKAYGKLGDIKIKFEKKVEPLSNLYEKGQSNRAKMRMVIFEMAMKKYNDIGLETSTQKISKNPYQSCIRRKKIEIYWHYQPSRNQFFTIIKCRSKYGDEKMMETWQELENNAEKINQRLPGVEWVNSFEDENLGGNKPHLDILCDVPEDFEKMSEEKIKEISEKIAENMKKAVDLVIELKL